MTTSLQQDPDRTVVLSPTKAPAPVPDRAGTIPTKLVSYLTGAGITILAALMFGLFLQVAGVGAVEHARAQKIAYAKLRGDLATATAPVSGFDKEGMPLPLGTPVALLEIPSIGLREVVGEGTTSDVLADGPGHRRDTVLPGQVGTSVIFGREHAYGGPFKKIGALVPGDRITVTTGQGVSTFVVIGARLAGSPITPYLAGTGRLTLAVGSGHHMFVPDGVLRVDAQLVGTPFAAGPRAVATAALPASEQALAGDPDAWLPIMLWTEALLIVSVALVWLRSTWGRWQTWLVAVPVVGASGFALADQVSRLLPNML